MSDARDHLRGLLLEYLEWLLLGERRRLTAAGLVIAVVMILVASVVDYLFLARVVAGSETNPFQGIRRTFRLLPFWGEYPPPPEMWVYGYLFVIMLAAVYAYFNAGYLVSVFLGVSTNIGSAVWSIHGMDEYVTLTPMLVFDRVFPVGPLVATLGFLLGLAIRRVTRQQTPDSTRTPSTPER